MLQPLNDLDLPGRPPASVRKLAFVDTETTGYQASKCDVIEVAVIRNQMPWESKVKITEFDERRGDTNGGTGWRKVTGYTREAWADAPDGSTVAVELAKQLHGTVIVALNAGFDEEVIARFLERYGIPWWSVYTRSMIDLHPLCKAMLSPLGVKKFDMETLCNFFGLEPEGEHRALGGATRVRLIFNELCKRVWRP